MQTGTVVRLALPAPAAADTQSRPGVSLPGLPSPDVRLIRRGILLTARVPPGVRSGTYPLRVRWASGRLTRIGLRVGRAIPLASGLGEPDDLTVAPDGSVLYSNVRDGTVEQLLPGGRTRTLVSGLSVPEGVAVADSRTMLIGEQGTNRVLAWNGRLRELLSLRPRPGTEGIDGLSVATVNRRPVAFIPDSANGRAYLLYLDTHLLVPVEGLWERPTGGFIRSGRLFLVDEYGGRLYVGHLRGPLEPLGPPMRLPDDVVVASDGTAFVNALGSGDDGEVLGVRPDGTWASALTGLREPQGLTLDGAENLVIAESGSGSISEYVRSCVPLLLSPVELRLRAVGPPVLLPLGSDCAPGVAEPRYVLAPGALWPAPGGKSISWAASGARPALSLPNGASVMLSGRLLRIAPSPDGRGAGGSSLVALRLRVGQRSVPVQIPVEVARR